MDGNKSPLFLFKLSARLIILLKSVLVWHPFGIVIRKEPFVFPVLGIESELINNLEYVNPLRGVHSLNNGLDILVTIDLKFEQFIKLSNCTSQGLESSVSWR